jgi:ABC-type sugar transport system substrate-binding protein
MKKIIVLCVVLLLSVGVLSFGTVEKAVGQEKFVFGYVAYQMIDVWNAYTVKGFQYAAKAKDVEVIVLDPEGSQEKSLAAVEDLITRDVNAINYYPITPELARTVIQMLNKEKIPVAIENMAPAEGPGEPVSVVYNGYDNMGYMVAKFLCEKFPGKKIYFVEGQRGMGIVELYMEGFDRALEEFGTIEMVGAQPTNWTQDEAMSVAQNVLQSGLEFDIMVANNEDMAKGVLKAVKEADKFGEILVMGGGGGGLPDGLELVKKGELVATTNTAPSLQGALAFKSLWQAVNGETPEKNVLLPITIITKDNIDKSVAWEPDQTLLDSIGF